MSDADDVPNIVLAATVDTSAALSASLMLPISLSAQLHGGSAVPLSSVSLPPPPITASVDITAPLTLSGTVHGGGKL